MYNDTVMKFGGEDPSKELTTVCVTNATLMLSQNETNTAPTINETLGH